VILATTVLLWSLSLAERATSPLARSRAASAPPVLIGALLAFLFLPAAAHALTSNALTAMARWKAMDKCAVQAQQAFPDFTAEANTKRDAKLQECLAGQNLPPRETPPSVR
jgi:hypothetical protein